MNNMNMQEASRVILGLRAAGWDEKEINDFILYIETGEEKYKPMQKNKPTEQAGNRQGRAGLPPLPHQKNYSKNKDGLQYAIPIQEKRFCAFFVCNFIHVINYLCIFLRDNIHGNLFSQDLAQGQIEFDVDATGKGFYRKRGADTWLPFSNALVLMDGTGSYAFGGINNGYYSNFQLDNFDYSAYSKIRITNLGTYPFEVVCGTTSYTSPGTFDISALKQTTLRIFYRGAAANPPILLKVELIP